jgi:hypothetical protein
VALPVNERAAVAASARHRGARFAGGTRRRTGFGRRRRFRVRTAAPYLDRRCDHGLDPYRRERIGIEEGDAQARRRYAVGFRRRGCGLASPDEISGLLDVVRVE